MLSTEELAVYLQQAAYVTHTTWSIITSIISQFPKNFNRQKTLKQLYIDLRHLLSNIYISDTINALHFAQGLPQLYINSFINSLFVLYSRLFHSLLKCMQPSNNNLYYSYFITRYLYPSISYFIAGNIALLMISHRNTSNTIAIFCIIRSIADLLRVLRY